MGTTAFLLQRIGPYHQTRLRALSRRIGGGLTVIEFWPVDKVYAWDTVPVDGAYTALKAHTRSAIRRALEAIGPDVVVCTGYADPEIHWAVDWALGRRIPVVTCSDSTYDDELRSPAKEGFKRQILAAFDAALVAGTRSRQYIHSLGIESARCFEPWDVVDNEHFDSGSKRSKANADHERRRLGLPRDYFLCVSRFVAKKNLPKLIDAFAAYCRKAGAEAWDLVLSGSGPLEPDLRRKAAESGAGDRVHFTGFLQYADLPSCYGLARAFVLPSSSDQWGLVVNEAMASGLPVLVSSRCGCAPDLVVPGGNGRTFNPDDPADTEGALQWMAQVGVEARNRMGERSRSIISAYSPQAFAAGLEAAAANARVFGRGAKPLHTRILLRMLAARRSHAIR